MCGLADMQPKQIIEYDQKRKPDYQYHDLLKKVIEEGREAVSGMDEGSIEILGYQLRYNLEKDGFPLITERDLTQASKEEIIANYKSDTNLRPVSGALKQALGEIIAFINGGRTQEELEYYGCNSFWKPWTTNEEKAKKRDLKLGDLGPGSYGVAFHDFPDENKTFNQYSAMIEQIKSRPELRTHIITPFIPPLISRAPSYKQKVLVVPCHGLQHYNIDIRNKEISLVHWQRSADAPIGFPFNLVHYAALLMMIGQVTGYKPKELVVQISNAHIYNQHLEKVKEILKREPYAFPRLTIDSSIKNLEDFRVEHFFIQDYVAHPPINMGGTAV